MEHLLSFLLSNPYLLPAALSLLAVAVVCAVAFGMSVRG